MNEALPEELFEPENFIFQKGTNSDNFYVAYDGHVRVKDIRGGQTYL